MNDPKILIDTNQYLDLYRLHTGQKLLEALIEQKQFVFVTVQHVQEVQRNKLQRAVEFLKSQLEQLKLPNISDHLFDSSEDAAKMRTHLKEVREKVEPAMRRLREIADRTVGQISRSEDPISKRLAELFARAIQHKPEELDRARERRERGNPPGKRSDPLGDQLIWEQFLNHFTGSNVWIISGDYDHFSEYDGKVLLNPFLYCELAQKSTQVPEIHCFKNLAEGLDHFVKNTGVRAEKLPSEKESKEIRKEIDLLPPVTEDWSPGYFAAVMSASSGAMGRTAPFNTFNPYNPRALYTALGIGVGSRSESFAPFPPYTTEEEKQPKKRSGESDKQEQS